MFATFTLSPADPGFCAYLFFGCEPGLELLDVSWSSAPGWFTDYANPAGGYCGPGGSLQAEYRDEGETADGYRCFFGRRFVAWALRTRWAQGRLEEWDNCADPPIYRTTVGAFMPAD